jgi:hypothetical protein
MARIDKVVFGSPVAAVNKENDRVGAFSGWHPNVHKLVWVLAIRKTYIGLRGLLAKDGFALHAEKV